MSDYSPFDLKENADAEQEKRDRAKLLEARDISDLQWVMGDERGRRFIYSQLIRSGIYRISYTGDNETFFREGMRNLGIMLLDDLKSHCDELYLTMEQERKNGRRSDTDTGNADNS